MDRFASILVLVGRSIGILILVGVFAERITAIIRRRAPRLGFEGVVFVLWGLLVIASFALGLTIMYILMRF